MPTEVQTRSTQDNESQILSKTAEYGAVQAVQHPSTRPLSKLETLPNEIIQAILWDSLNLNLTIASPILARNLNNNSLRRDFIFLAFFECTLKTTKHIQSYGDDEIAVGEMQRLTFYHDRYGTNLDHTSQCLLINSIVDKAWFSTKLLLSCQREYLSKIVPSPFSDLLHPQLTLEMKPWTILQQTAPGQLQQWFTELSCLQTTDEQRLEIQQEWNDRAGAPGFLRYTSAQYYDEGRFGVSCNIEPAPGLGEVTDFIWINLTWIVGESRGLEHEFIVSMTEFNSRDPEPSPCILNPATWTMDSLALLSILTRWQDIRRPSQELLDTTSKGIMLAISQKIVPAVFILCSVRVSKENQKMSGPNAYILNDLWQQIYDYASERIQRGDSLFDSWWITRNVPWKQPICSDPRNRRKRVKAPLSSEHLIRAMQSACEPQTGIGSYYIFCWVAIAFMTDITNQNLPFPKDVLNQIHHLADITGKSGCARKCYGFLKNAINQVWSIEAEIGDMELNSVGSIAASDEELSAEEEFQDEESDEESSDRFSEESSEISDE